MNRTGPGKAVIQCQKANHGPTGWAVELEADLRSRDAKPDVFAGWKILHRYSPSEWEAEQNRRKADAKGAKDKQKTKRENPEDEDLH